MELIHPWLGPTVPRERRASLPEAWAGCQALPKPEGPEAGPAHRGWGWAGQGGGGMEVEPRGTACSGGGAGGTL